MAGFVEEVDRIAAKWKLVAVGPKELVKGLRDRRLTVRNLATQDAYLGSCLAVYAALAQQGWQVWYLYVVFFSRASVASASHAAAATAILAVRDQRGLHVKVRRKAIKTIATQLDDALPLSQILRDTTYAVLAVGP